MNTVYRPAKGGAGRRGTWPICEMGIETGSAAVGKKRGLMRGIGGKTRKCGRTVKGRIIAFAGNVGQAARRRAKRVRGNYASPVSRSARSRRVKRVMIRLKRSRAGKNRASRGIEYQRSKKQTEISRSMGTRGAPGTSATGHRAQRKSR